MKKRAGEGGCTGSPILTLDWLPIALVLIGTVTLAVLDIRTVYEPRWLMPAMNLTFFAGASLVAAVLAAKAFRDSGAGSVLMMGGGLLCFGLATVAGAVIIAIAGNTNAGVTTHNLGSLVAGCFHMVSAVALTLGRRLPPGRKRPAEIAGTYGLAGLIMSVITALSLTGHMPMFVARDQEMPIRNVIIAATIAEYLMASAILAQIAHARQAEFLRRYWQGLVLVGLGLLGVGATGAIGSPLSWIGRVSQCLGQLYMVVSLLTLASGRSGETAAELIGESFRQIETERRQAREALTHATRRLALAREVTSFATWQWDVTTGQMEWSEDLFRLFGIDPATARAAPETWRSVVHPEDYQAASTRLEEGVLKTGTLTGDYRIVRPGGTVRWIEAYGATTRDAVTGRVQMSGACIDVTERKQAEEKIRQQNAILEGINRVFREALTCRTEEQIGRLCLQVAQDLTGSKFGFIGELNESGRLADIAISDPGWEACRMARPMGDRIMPTGFEIHGIYGRVILGGKALFTNAPASHPDSIGTPEGHPPLTAFLGVPLIQNGRTIGMMAVGNRKGGYDEGQITALEALAEPVVQVLMRRRAEQELNDGKEKYKSLAMNVPSVLMSFDRDLKVVHLSPKAEEITGIPAHDFLGRTNREMGMPEHLCDIWDRAITEVFRTGENSELEFELGSGPGRRAFYLKFAPERDANGDIRHVLGISTEITARKRAEDALRENEQKLQALAQQVPAILWTTDTEYRYTLSVGSALQSLGLENHEVEGKTMMEVMETSDPAHPALAATAKSLRGESTVYEIPYRGRYFRALIRPLRDSDGVIVGTVGVSLDMTERKLAEDALHEADRRKDEFLAMLAHELRNPLSAISSAIYVLKMRETADPAIIRARDAAVRQVAHMSRLVDDLLDVSRVTRGKIVLKRQQVALSSAIESAMEATRPLIEARGHRLFLSLPHEPLLLEGDQVRLAQIFSNLLNNAAKFTPQGGQIRLSVERRDDQAIVRVADTGTGIDPQLLPRVFDMFVQADNSLDRAQGGLGIGLTMVRSLVEMHGGRVEACSDGPGKGSEFVVRLPLCQAHAAGSEPDHYGPVAPVRRRILVVDDNADAAEMLAALLETDGHQVLTARSGQAALDIAAGSPPEVALLDIGMPEMDGMELARRMRRQPALAGIVLVAVTGYGQEEDIQKTREAGFDHHLVKPVEQEKLRRLLASAGRRRAGTA